MRLYLLVKSHGAPKSKSYMITPGTYKVQRLAALKTLSQMYDYSKIPWTWLEVVADTHEGFLEQTFIVYTDEGIPSYSYRRD